MSEIIEAKIRSVCSNNQLKDLYMVDVHEAVMEVFKKINYTPSKDIEESVDKAWANSDREDYLADFIYNVWRFDS